jgi:hypothetical protein
MSAIFLLIALASSVPSANIQATCRSAREAALPEDRSGAYDSCVRSEEAAKQKLQGKWKQYSLAAHAACSETGGFSFSYVELQVCLEMQPGGSLSMQKAGAPPSEMTPALPVLIPPGALGGAPVGRRKQH